MFGAIFFRKNFWGQISMFDFQGTCATSCASDDSRDSHHHKQTRHRANHYHNNRACKFIRMNKVLHSYFLIGGQELITQCIFMVQQLLEVSAPFSKPFTRSGALHTVNYAMHCFILGYLMATFLDFS